MLRDGGLDVKFFILEFVLIFSLFVFVFVGEDGYFSYYRLVSFVWVLGED